MFTLVDFQVLLLIFTSLWISFQPNIMGLWTVSHGNFSWFSVSLVTPEVVAGHLSGTHTSRIDQQKVGSMGHQ
jgi:hypothetical protein